MSRKTIKEEKTDSITGFSHRDFVALTMLSSLYSKGLMGHREAGIIAQALRVESVGRLSKTDKERNALKNIADRVLSRTVKAWE